MDEHQLFQAAKRIVLCKSTDEIYENLRHLRSAVESCHTKKIRTLVLQELDYCNLPLDGTNVVYFDSSTSFGMFEQHYTQMGKVVYMHGDIADTLEDALAVGGYISLARNDLEGDGNLAINICIDGENTTLLQGCLWMYEHDYLPVIDPHYFPFQDWEYYQIALEQGWCKILKEFSETHQMEQQGNTVNVTWVYHTVGFNGAVFNVEWISYESATPHLHGYTVKE